MARVAICEPVAETRELLERFVAHLGHEVVGADPEVVLYEPAGPVSFDELRALHPDAAVVVASIETPPVARGQQGWTAWLLKPFGLDELGRGLRAAADARDCAAWPATPSASPAT